MPRKFRSPRLRYLDILCAGVFGVSALVSLPATAQEDKVFFCPPAVVAGMSKPTKGIMCDANTCYDSQSPDITAEQKTFLLSSGACRYLSSEEIASYWHAKRLASRSGN